MVNSTKKHERRRKRLIFISKTTPGGGWVLLEQPETVVKALTEKLGRDRGAGAGGNGKRGLNFHHFPHLLLTCTSWSSCQFVPTSFSKSPLPFCL